ncbi:MAG TPA: hypothetical protein VIS52_02090, partial [Motiliproteus sp.]
MKCFIGIDLGSTTTKSVVMDETGRPLGHGITNSRSNYDTAALVAKTEALISARLQLLRQRLEQGPTPALGVDQTLEGLERHFRLAQFMDQLKSLESLCGEKASDSQAKGGIGDALNATFRNLEVELAKLFAPGAERKSDFFRDLAGSVYMEVSEGQAREFGVSQDTLINMYDKSIIEVENLPPKVDMDSTFLAALDSLHAEGELSDTDFNSVREILLQVLAVELEETYVVGTGYGRA